MGSDEKEPVVTAGETKIHAGEISKNTRPRRNTSDRGSKQRPKPRANTNPNDDDSSSSESDDQNRIPSRLHRFHATEVANHKQYLRKNEVVQAQYRKEVPNGSLQNSINEALKDPK